jgi:biopolymer transport protein ExbB/TolQ
LGIFVAIPAVVAYNQFTGNLENFRVEMNRASSQLINHLFKVPELMAREARLQQESEIVVREEAYARR